MQEAARRAQQRSYRPITEEEQQTLLPQDQQLKEQDQRNKYVFDAVDSLSFIFLLLAWTVIFVLILVFINEYTDDAIPIWGIFLVIWVGHFILFLLTLRIIRLILRSLFTRKDQERFTQRWHQANEKRIPLIQYVFYHLAWILGLSMIILIFEILLYLYYDGQVPLWSTLIPLYIITGIATLNSLICRSTSTSSALTWSLLLTLTIMFNIFILYPNSLTYDNLFVPVLILFGLWICIVLYVWMNYVLANYRLKSFQIEALSFYTVSFVFLLLSSIALLLYYDDETFYGYSYQKIATGCAIIGACCFFIACYRVIVAALATAVRRMGAERPLSLKKLESGGWDIDENNNFELYLILGEVETNAPIFLSEKTVVDRFICGCCNSTIEMISGCSTSNDKQNSFTEHQ